MNSNQPRLNIVKLSLYIKPTQNKNTKTKQEATHSLTHHYQLLVLHCVLSSAVNGIVSLHLDFILTQISSQALGNARGGRGGVF